jgi:uncharacterized OB-fold protein
MSRISARKSKFLREGIICRECGKYYDPSRYEKCPYCGAEQQKDR